MNLHVEQLQDDLGPVTLDISSSLFIVAGAVSVVLKLHSPPSTLKVYAIKVYIDQKVDVTSFRDPSKTATLRHKAMLLERGWEGPYTAKALQQIRQDGRERKGSLFDGSASGEGWEFEQVARVVSPPPASWLAFHPLMSLGRQLYSNGSFPPLISKFLSLGM